MSPSRANVQPKQKQAKPATPKQHTISLPPDQVTAEPVPGYTTQDFWQDFERQHGSPNDAFQRFEEFTRRLVQVPKSEIDARLTRGDRGG